MNSCSSPADIEPQADEEKVIEKQLKTIKAIRRRQPEGSKANAPRSPRPFRPKQLPHRCFNSTQNYKAFIRPPANGASSNEFLGVGASATAWAANLKRATDPPKPSPNARAETIPSVGSKSPGTALLRPDVCFSGGASSPTHALFSHPRPLPPVYPPSIC